MLIVYAIVAIPLALGLLASAQLKLTKNPRIVEGIGGRLGVPLKWFPALAALEIAGALGLIAGLWIGPLGAAAGVGIVCYFIGAASAHLRAHDNKGVATPVVLGLAGAAALSLRFLSL